MCIILIISDVRYFISHSPGIIRLYVCFRRCPEVAVVLYQAAVQREKGYLQCVVNCTYPFLPFFPLDDSRRALVSSLMRDCSAVNECAGINVSPVPIDYDPVRSPVQSGACTGHLQ